MRQQQHSERERALLKELQVMTRDLVKLDQQRKRLLDKRAKLWEKGRATSLTAAEIAEASDVAVITVRQTIRRRRVGE